MEVRGREVRIEGRVIGIACLDGEAYQGSATSYQFLDDPGAALTGLRRLKGLPPGRHGLYYASTRTNTQLSNLWILNKAIYQEDNS
jgi:hypothetical protein